MRKSIFEIENRLDICSEYKRLLSCLYERDSIFYDGLSMSLWRFINEYVFNLWDYRDTFIDLESYLEHIGVLDYSSYGNVYIEEIPFLNFLELLLNLKLVIDGNYKFNSICYSQKVREFIDRNVPLILEKMNYAKYNEYDRVLIRKRDADVDSVLELVPEDIQTLLLDYNDIRNNTLESKKTILKKLDLFIEKDKKKYKGLNASTYDSIQIIVNKMGINHPITEQPYSDLKSDELIKWYDKCFKLMIHLIRIENINEINADRKKISG